MKDRDGDIIQTIEIIDVDSVITNAEGLDAPSDHHDSEQSENE